MSHSIPAMTVYYVLVTALFFAAMAVVGPMLFRSFASWRYNIIERKHSGRALI